MGDKPIIPSASHPLSFDSHSSGSYLAEGLEALGRVQRGGLRIRLT
ncbi:hypothetical protein HMPREF1121_00581 [Porphyromonas sp. KLE 1280]|nr:hypothetical protein HMPREF1121_00581 [Porphyromonas sp. KLE 1280]